MSNRRFNKASSDFETDLASLRDDLSRLTGSVADLLKARANDVSEQAGSFFGRARDRAQGHAADVRDEARRRANDARDKAYDAREKTYDYASNTRDRVNTYASDARDRAAGYASDAQDRLGAFGSDIEGKIEKNPLTAVVVAGIAGLLMGMFEPLDLMFGFVARMIGGAVTPLLDQISAFGVSLLRKLILFLVAGLCLGVVVLALTLAFAFWISSLAGPIVAALAVAGLYLVVAAGAALLAMQSSKAPLTSDAKAPLQGASEPNAALGPQIDQFTAPLLDLLKSLGLRREQLAVLAGASIAKKLGPVPLVGIAIIAGFVVGRMWRGWDKVFSNDLVESVLAFVMPAKRATANEERETT